MKFLNFFILILAISCGDDMDRAEILDRVRGLGIELSPLLGVPSDNINSNTVTAKYFMTLPLNVQAVVEPYLDKDEGAFYNLQTENISIQEDSFVYEDYEQFRLLTFEASLTVPSVTELDAKRWVRYGVKVDGAGDVEYINGTFLISSEESIKNDFKDVSIDLIDPVAQTTLAKDTRVKVSSIVSNPNSENSKIAWFISAGEIENRRSLETYWQTPETPGKHYLIATIRGVKSFAFNLKLIEVIVE